MYFPFKCRYIECPHLSGSQHNSVLFDCQRISAVGDNLGWARPGVPHEGPPVLHILQEIPQDFKTCITVMGLHVIKCPWLKTV